MNKVVLDLGGTGNMGSEKVKYLKVTYPKRAGIGYCIW